MQAVVTVLLRRRTIASLSARGMIVVACVVLIAPPAVAQETNPERGQALYLGECAYCHGNEGEGTSRAPSLQDVGAASAHFMLSTGRMPLDEPTTRLRRAPPAYDPEDLDAIVAFVASLGEGPEIPEVDPQRGDITLGEELYRTQCAACHAPAGIGTAITQGRSVPPIDQATPVQIAEAMIVGPGPMPRFVPTVFDDHEVDSIVRYVMFLQDPPNPGGHGLRNVGPVAEGLVAWLIAVPVLLMVMHALGRKRGD